MERSGGNGVYKVSETRRNNEDEDRQLTQLGGLFR